MGRTQVTGVGDHRWQCEDPLQCVQESMWLHTQGSAFRGTALVLGGEMGTPCSPLSDPDVFCCRMAITWERSLCAKPVLE